MCFVCGVIYVWRCLIVVHVKACLAMCLLCFAIWLRCVFVCGVLCLLNVDVSGGVFVAFFVCRGLCLSCAFQRAVILFVVDVVSCPAACLSCFIFGVLFVL